jgi:hypothetical protein
MGTEPVPKGARLPVREQVDGPPGLDVDQDRAVDAAAAEREVVDPEHADRPPAAGLAGPSAAAACRSGQRSSPARRPAAPRPGRPAPPRPPRVPPSAAGSAAHTAWSGPRPARRTSCACSRAPRRRTGARSAGSSPSARRSPHRPAAWNSGCGRGPRQSRTSGTPPRRHAPWPRRTAARRPPRFPRPSPRPDAAGEPSAQRHQGMTSTHHLATMTTRTPGRTAGLDNRWTTRSPSARHGELRGSIPARRTSCRQGQMPSRNGGQIQYSAVADMIPASQVMDAVMAQIAAAAIISTCHGG